MLPSRSFLLFFTFSLFVPPLTAGDWLHWRGPEQNGVSRETGLPETFSLDPGSEENLLWKKEYNGRSAPLVMGGRLYAIGGFDASKTTEGERIYCLNADTGEKVWEVRFGVYHTDIVSSRLGWTTLAADPKEKTIFAHTTAGALMALDADSGKLKWQRQLTEEFGRVTGYGGRIASPLFDGGSGLLVVGFVNGSWGDQARGGSRFAAFDGKTGDVVWWREVSTTQRPLKGTYYSNPVVAVINGQRLVISGGADGGLHAMKIRTGELMWSYHFSAMVVNPSPVVDGNLVYCAHGEPNPEGGKEGRVICVDASKVENMKPKLVWEYKEAKRCGLGSPALADGKLFVPEDGGALLCFNAATGKLLWEYKYGTTARGSPLVAGGTVYIFEINGKLSVITKVGNKKPSEDDVTEFTFKFADPKKKGFVETPGTPIAVNGKLYFQTAEFLYCVGTKGAKVGDSKYKPMPMETPFDPNAKPASVLVFPADVSAKPGAEIQFAIKYVDANGRELPAPADAKPEWSLPLPPKTPAGAQPPALAGEVKNGTVKLAPNPGQQGYVDVKVGELTARARVRVVPQLPVKQDFEKVPVGATPGGWVNTQGKYTVEEVEIGGQKMKVLSKVNNDSRPPIARANAYITAPTSTNYTIQADVYAGEVGGKLPDMGVIVKRALFVLEGKTTDDKRNVTIVSWEARNRIRKEVEFHWNKDTWYTMKFTAETDNGKTVLKGKVWERGKPEPKEWTIEVEDPNPNAEGAAALYGYVPNITTGPGSPIYYDNVSVTPNK
ncbi:MAG: PQQ-binding-like beta-propeller repeat protein [Fimbriiglobus sp.]|jgi:outer membrane protein assembly factor BamB|nr:PQQ-binding-like beta-propeller repeat protein [Fimbriiglobus sp.]